MIALAHHGEALRTFQMAAVSVKDVDLVSVYDCYTITVRLTLEDAGFCPKGRSRPSVEEHDLSHRGDLPLNTREGQLSFGQPGLPAADRQAPSRELAFVSDNGRVMSEQASLVLGR